MDRRFFILGALAAAGASRAEAAVAPASPPAPLVKREPVASLDDLKLEYAQGQNQSPHWQHRDSRFRHRPRHVRRRQVCRFETDRRGRRVRQCRWVWI